MRLKVQVQCDWCQEAIGEAIAIVSAEGRILRLECMTDGWDTHRGEEWCPSCVTKFHEDPYR